MKIPTLYIMGENDHMFLKPVKAIAAKHRHAKLQVIDDCGHVCNVEKSEQFNRHSLDFLERQSAPKTTKIP
ncbi:hypothetical protein [Ferrimonas pelagia]|uniref:alpha/beta fold hydrolase n=1 Tax=Ferrimonas pelagia TaxID=1177826 RepID=UPI0031F0D44F